ncbi:hypothetical protein E9531_15045 [Lampropedia puyangensis]|uniref:Uncharacterized protein n=1 Tax=Lampropedia puyangensis TaxID=1330072 RepID=A0A4S8EWX9_9BURK|nr:hypothetical protein [Lampropedia puyangensis]THT98113.1 hypothetical protein E9531_15045 [Lampropedia puyangensis]
MKHIAQVLENTFANWQAPRPVKHLTPAHAKFLQRPLFRIPQPAAVGQACAARTAAGKGGAV